MKTFYVELRTIDNKKAAAVVQARNFDLVIDSLRDDKRIADMGGAAQITLIGEVTDKVYWLPGVGQ